MPRVSLIAALSDNRVIGRDGGLPWSLPDDMRWFMRTTTGHPVIMGRVNFESFGKPLPRRTNIVLTRRRDYAAPGVVPAHSLDEALRLAERHLDDFREHRPDGEAGELFVIGGEDIYELALPRADRMYLTHVHAEVPGDRYFPAFDPGDWRITTLQEHPPDERHAYRFTIKRYDRA